MELLCNTPHELVSMITLAVKIMELMNIPIVGLVENMSYFRCPDNGKDYQTSAKAH